jgi:phage shock protein PspC (stress-responsive transcriptional regulator)
VSSIWTIRRSPTDVKLTGLCGGVARYLGVDPTLIRVGVALLALSGGVGLVLYLAGWLLIPVEGETKSPIDDLLGSQARRWSKEIWVAIVVVACIISFAILGTLTPFGVGPAIILAGIWYFGFYKNRKPRQTSASPPPAVEVPQTREYDFITQSGPATPFTEAAEAWRMRIEENARQSSSQQGPSPDEDAPGGTPKWPGPPAGNLASTSSPEDLETQQRRAFLAEPDPVGLYSTAVAVTQSPVATLRRAESRPARTLRLVSLIALSITLAGLSLADLLGAAVPVAAYFGAGLLVIGLALIVAAGVGRARGLLPLGMVLLIGLLTTSAISTAARYGDWARTEHSYTSVAQLPPNGDSREFGRLTTDLSELSLTGDVTYRAHVDLGTLTVVVPPEARVRVNYTIDSGAVEVFSTVVAAGNELHDTFQPEAPTATGPTLTLDLSAEMGKVVVRR